MAVKEQTYNVTFVGEYMTLTTHVSSKDEEGAEANAMELINEYYGWDLTEAMLIDIVVEGMS